MTDLKATTEIKKGDSHMTGMSNKHLRSLVRFAVFATALPVIITTACGTNMTTGSCCTTDGTCSVTTMANCTGTFTAGGTCSPNPCVDTLFSGIFAADNSTSVAIGIAPCYAGQQIPAHNSIQQNFNATGGKLVTVSVTGPTTTSRPRILVGDAMAMVQANSGASPTSQTTTTTFTPAGDQQFILIVEDCTPSAQASYTLLVTQAK